MADTNGVLQHPPDLDTQLNESRKRREIAEHQLHAAVAARQLQKVQAHTQSAPVDARAVLEALFGPAYGASMAMQADIFRYPRQAIGQSGDRRGGRDWPLWNNENELMLLLAQSRDLCHKNPQAKGLLKALTRYVVGTGPTFTAEIQKNLPLPDTDQNTPGEQLPPWVYDVQQKTQKVIDDFVKRNKYKRLCVELFRRTRRDGEAFLRYFHDDWQTNIRVIEPEQIRNPPGGTEAEGWSLGIRHFIDPETGHPDVQTPVAYNIAPKDYLQPMSNIVPADRIHHIKHPDTDVTIKRGIPDFVFQTAEALDRAHLLQRNSSTGEAIRQAVALITQYANATKDQVTSLVDEQKNRLEPAVSSTVLKQTQDMEPGQHWHIPQGQESTTLPTSVGNSVAQQILAGDCKAAVAGFSAPLYFLGETGQDNFASTKEHGAPFIRVSEGEQEDYGEEFTVPVEYAVKRAIEAEILPEYTLYVVEIKCKLPQIIQRDPVQQAQTNQMKLQAGVISPQMWIKDDGNDPDDVISQTADWQKQMAPAQPQPGQPGPDGQPPQGPQGQPQTGQQDPGAQQALGAAGAIGPDSDSVQAIPESLLEDAGGHYLDGVQQQKQPQQPAPVQQPAHQPVAQPAQPVAQPQLSGKHTAEGVPLEHAKALSRDQARDHLKFNPKMTMVVGSNAPNRAFPDETRPQLTDHESGALQKYTYLNDRPLNRKLRGHADWHQWDNGKGQTAHTPYGDGFFDEMHGQMQSAFAKAQPLAKPIQVTRGMYLQQAQLDEFIGNVRKSHAAGTPIQFNGYTSTAKPGGVGGFLHKLGVSDGIKKNFRGNVNLQINAVHGLDMKPHSQLPGEEEFLLNHGSQFKIQKVSQNKNGYIVHLDQLHPQKSVTEAVSAPQPDQSGEWPAQPHTGEVHSNYQQFYEKHGDHHRGRWLDTDAGHIQFAHQSDDQDDDAWEDHHHETWGRGLKHKHTGETIHGDQIDDLEAGPVLEDAQDVKPQSSAQPVPPKPDWQSRQRPSGQTVWTNPVSGAELKRKSKPGIAPEEHAQTTVSMSDRAYQRHQQVFPGIKKEHLADLVGAMPGSKITSGGHYFQSGSTVITVEHPKLINQLRTLTEDDDGNVIMKNNMFFMKKKHRGGGEGGAVFSRQVQAAHQHGINHIETTAGKGAGMNGYATWPILGYDAPLVTAERHGLPDRPEHLAGAKTIQELFALPGGKDWWSGAKGADGKRAGGNGVMMSMQFDLAPDSPSMKAHNAYLQSRGQQPLQQLTAEEYQGKQEVRRQAKHEALRGQVGEPWAQAAKEEGVDENKLHKLAQAGMADALKMERLNNPNVPPPRVQQSNRKTWEASWHDKYNTALYDLMGGKLSGEHIRQREAESAVDAAERHKLNVDEIHTRARIYARRPMNERKEEKGEGWKPSQDHEFVRDTWRQSYRQAFQEVHEANLKYGGFRAVTEAYEEPDDAATESFLEGVFDLIDLGDEDAAFSLLEDWTGFTGKRGGKGWRNSATGKVVYQTDKPGDKKKAIQDAAAKKKQGAADVKTEAVGHGQKARESIAKVGQGKALSGAEIAHLATHIGKLTVPEIKAALKALQVKGVSKLAKAALQSKVMANLGATKPEAVPHPEKPKEQSAPEPQEVVAKLSSEDLHAVVGNKVKELAEGSYAGRDNLIPISEIRKAVAAQYGDVNASGEHFDEAVKQLWRDGAGKLVQVSDPSRTDKDELAGAIPGAGDDQFAWVQLTDPDKVQRLPSHLVKEEKPAKAEDVQTYVMDVVTEMAENEVGGLVPIHKIRDAVRAKFGDATASHKHLNDQIKQLWRDGKVKMVPLSDSTGITGKQQADSIHGNGETLYYLKTPAAQLEGFDPTESRDTGGKWTAGGSGTGGGQIDKIRSWLFAKLDSTKGGYDWLSLEAELKTEFGESAPDFMNVLDIANEWHASKQPREKKSPITGVKKGKLLKLPISSLNFRGEILPDVEPLSDNSDEPIIVMIYKNRYRIIDGFGRANGMRNAGESEIHAILVSDGDLKNNPDLEDDEDWVAKIHNKYAPHSSLANQG